MAWQAVALFANSAVLSAACCCRRARCPLPPTRAFRPTLPFPGPQLAGLYSFKGVIAEGSDAWAYVLQDPASSAASYVVAWR